MRFQRAPAGGIGDDACYSGAGAMVSLFTKKGSVAFKTSVQSQLPLSTLESLESKLAQQAASRLSAFLRLSWSYDRVAIQAQPSSAAAASAERNDLLCRKAKRSDHHAAAPEGAGPFMP